MCGRLRALCPVGFLGPLGLLGTLELLGPIRLLSSIGLVGAIGTRFGHNLDAQFTLGLGLAALSLSRGALFPPGDSSGVEIEMMAAPSQIVVIGTGHWRGEGMALVEAVG